MDNAKKPTMCVDVCVSPKTMHMAGSKGPTMVKEVLGVCCAEALRQIESRLHVTSLHMDPRSFVVLQGTKYMGGAKKPAAINVHARRQRKRAVQARVDKLRKEKEDGKKMGKESGAGSASAAASGSGAASAGGSGKAALKERRAARKQQEQEAFPDGALPVPRSDVTLTERGSLAVTIPHADIAKIEAMLPKRPESLVLRVRCRGMAKVSAAALDVQEKAVQLEYPVPEKAAASAGVKAGTYRLLKDLPHPVDVDSCRAAFVRSKQQLEVTMKVIPHNLDAKRCAELVAQYDARAREAGGSASGAGAQVDGNGAAVEEVDVAEATPASTLPDAGDGGGSTSDSAKTGGSVPPTKQAKGHDRWVSGTRAPQVQLPEAGAATKSVASSESSSKTGSSEAAAHAGPDEIGPQHAQPDTKAGGKPDDTSQDIASPAAKEKAPASPDRYSAEAMLHAAAADSDSDSADEEAAAVAGRPAASGAGDSSTASEPSTADAGSVAIAEVVHVSSPHGMARFCRHAREGAGRGEPTRRPPFSWRQSGEHVVLLVQVPLAVEEASSVVLRRRGGAVAPSGGDDGKGGARADEIEVCIASRIGGGFVERLKKHRAEGVSGPDTEATGSIAKSSSNGINSVDGHGPDVGSSQWGIEVPVPSADGNLPGANAADGALVGASQCPAPGEPSPWFASFDLATGAKGSVEEAEEEAPLSTWRVRIPLSGTVVVSTTTLDAADCNVAVWVTKAPESEGQWERLVATGAQADLVEEVQSPAAGAAVRGRGGAASASEGRGREMEAASAASSAPTQSKPQTTAEPQAEGSGSAPMRSSAPEGAAASPSAGSRAPATTQGSKPGGAGGAKAAVKPAEIAAPRVRLSEAAKAFADDLD